MKKQQPKHLCTTSLLITALLMCAVLAMFALCSCSALGQANGEGGNSTSSQTSANSSNANGGVSSGSDGTETNANASKTTASSTTTPAIIGNTDADAWDLRISNSAEKSITGIAIKYPDADTHTKNLLAEGERISTGDTSTLKVEKRGDTSQSSYFVDIKLTFTDGTVSDLHHIDVLDTDAINVYLQGKIAYCMYNSTSAGAMVSTLALQTWWYNQDDPEAAARDAQEEQEELRRLEKLEQDLRSYEESANTNSTSNTSNSSSTSNTSASNTNEDVQSNDLEDDPIETNYDGPSED